MNLCDTMWIRERPQFQNTQAVTGLQLRCQKAKISSWLINITSRFFFPFCTLLILRSQSVFSERTLLRLTRTRYTTGRGTLQTITICTISCLPPSTYFPSSCFLQMWLLQRDSTFTVPCSPCSFCAVTAS